MESKNIHRLPDGPITGPRFVPAIWMLWQDAEGRWSYQAYSQEQYIGVMVRNCEKQILRNMQFASMMQGGCVA